MVLTIDQKWLDANRNEKVDQSSLDYGKEYFGKTGGAGRGLGAAQKTIKVAREVGLTAAPKIVALQSNLGIAVGALGIIQVPSATCDAIDSVTALAHPEDEVPVTRKVTKAIRDTLGAASSWVYAAAFVGFNPIIAFVGQILDVPSSLADLKISYDDYRQAAKLEEIAEGDAKEALTHSKNYYFWRTVKSTAAVAIAIFAVILLFTVASWIAITALAILGLGTTCLAIRNDWMKDAGKYKVIPFDQTVVV